MAGTHPYHFGVYLRQTPLTTFAPGCPNRLVSATHSTGFADPWFSTAQMMQAKANPPHITDTGGQGRGELKTRDCARYPAGRIVRDVDAVAPGCRKTAEEVREIALALGADPRHQYLLLGDAASESRIKSKDLSQHSGSRVSRPHGADGWRTWMDWTPAPRLPSALRR